QQPTKGMFAICGPDRPEPVEPPAFDPRELAVMGERPLAAPELAAEGVRVGQRHPSAVGPTNMGERDATPDRAFADKARNLRSRALRRIMEDPAGRPVIERYAPAVAIRPRRAAALCEAREAETDVGRHIGAHPQKLAHGRLGLPGCSIASGY